MKKKTESTGEPTGRIANWALQTFNNFGQIFASIGIPMGYANVESILKGSMKRSGVDTIFDDSFIEPLNVLVKNANQQPSFTLSGRLLFRGLLIHRVRNRLQIDATLDANPEILKQPVGQPIFIAALPRTATTLLHRLFAQDSAIRVPLFWEMQYPCPPPEPETSATDPRIARVGRELAIFNHLVSQMKAIHEMGPSFPEECIMLFANDLIGDYFTSLCDLPAYEEWLFGQDFRTLYERHKKQLQLLQYRYPQKRWVLKAPSHLRALRTLAQVYPDACIIQTHRDPGEIVASASSLFATTRSFFHHNIHSETMGKRTLEMLGRMLDQSMADRQQLEQSSNSRVRFVDVKYKDFIKQPIETMRSVYEQCDLAWTSSIEHQITTHLKENRQHKHGKHKYTLEQFGLEKEQVAKRFAAYNKRFLQ